jgi:hypothetical protein
MAESRGCADVRELIPELAMGVASGDDRARALKHLAGCADCRRELEDVTATVDELLLLAPEHEPPPGFDGRVLSAMQPQPPLTRHRAPRVLLAVAAAAAVAVLAAGFTWWQGSDDRDLADQYRDTLAVADGEYLRAGDLTVDGISTGNVFAYEGDQSWVFVTVDGAKSGTYHVELVTSDGHSRWLGLCKVRGGSGSWGTTVDVPVGSVEQVEMFGDGLPTMSATLEE